MLSQRRLVATKISTCGDGLWGTWGWGYPFSCRGRFWYDGRVNIQGLSAFCATPPQLLLHVRGKEFEPCLGHWNLSYSTNPKLDTTLRSNLIRS